MNEKIEENKTTQLDQAHLLQLRKQAHTLTPLVRIGKAGLNQNILEEIGKQLRIHHLVKIKLLKNFMDDIPLTKRELGEQIAAKTGAALVAVVGNTVVVWK